MSAELIAKIAGGSVEDMLPLVRCGFELENQSFMGYTSDDMGSNDDDDSYDESPRSRERVREPEFGNYISDLVAERLADSRYTREILNVSGISNHLKPAILAFATARGEQIGTFYGDYLSSLAPLVRPSVATLRAAGLLTEYAYMVIADQYGNYLRRVDALRQQFTEVVEQVTEDLLVARAKNAGHWHPSLELGEDGSVDGFEIRTTGAETIESFTAACKAAFKNKMVVDIGCSFHIHASVLGMRHQYGKNMQLWLMEHLLRNIERVPADVLTRWREATSGRQRDTLTEDGEPPIVEETSRCHYFRPMLRYAKYTFIHYHSQGTWEFRCFGNIRNAEDGLVCLQLATEALHFAYRVADGKATSLLSQKDFPSSENAPDFIWQCIDEGVNLETVLELDESRAA